MYPFSRLVANSHSTPKDFFLCCVVEALVEGGTSLVVFTLVEGGISLVESPLVEGGISLVISPPGFRTLLYIEKSCSPPNTRAG